MDKKTLGSMIKKVRTEKGITQQQLAEALGLKHSQEIAAFESGTVEFPKRYIPKLIKAFGVSKEQWMKMFEKRYVQKFRDEVAKYE
jgi:transcriptional regulator with XRE-family HTH domain